MANKGFQIGNCEDIEVVDCKWTETALVLSNDVPAVVKFVARIAKRFLGARIQICDGVEDDITVKAAHDALPAAGGRLVLTAGDFNFGPTTGTLAMDRASVTTGGQGDSTRIVVVILTPGTNNTIDVTANHCVVEDLHIEGGGALGTASGNGGVRVTGADFVTTQHVTTNNTKLGGVGYDECKHGKVLNCTVQNPGGSTATGMGIGFYDLCEDCMADDCTVIGAKEHGFRCFDNGSGALMRCKFSNCTALSCTECGFNVDDCVEAELSNCHATLNGLNGFSISATSNGTTLTGCHGRQNTLAGFRSLSRNEYVACYAIANTEEGFYTQGNSSNFSACEANGNGVDGFRLHNGARIDFHGVVSTGNTGWGINLTGTSGFFRMFGGYIDNNTAGSVTGWNTNSQAVGVRGWVTENSGSDSIGAAAVAVNVTHGLDLTPQDGDIMVTPTNDMGNATKMWVSAYAADTFTVTIDAVPGGVDTADFAWKAMVLPH